MVLVTIQHEPEVRQLAASAAASYNRMRTDGLPAGNITSAYRSNASQEKIFFARYHKQWVGSGRWGDVKWYKGVRYVRNDSALLPASAPGKSDHNQGLAMDIPVNSPQYKWLIAHGASHGWTRPMIKTDPVHWVYNSKYDQDARDQAAARKTLKAVQKALRVALSGQLDSTTRKAAHAVESANDSPRTFPYGVPYAQTHSGASADGKWGPKSTAANTKTVKAVQTALGQTPDGHWGTKTQTDLESTARKAK